MLDKSNVKIVCNVKNTPIYSEYIIQIENKNKIYHRMVIYCKANLVNANHRGTCVELRQRQELRHRNIVNILDSFQDSENIYLVCDSNNTVSFKCILEHPYYIDKVMLVCFITQTIDAINYLEKKNVFMVALPPENILVNLETCLLKINPINLTTFDYLREPKELDFIADDVIKNKKPFFLAPFYSLGVIVNRMKELIVDKNLEFESNLNELIEFMLTANEKVENYVEWIKDLKSCKIFKDENWENIEIKNGNIIEDRKYIYEYFKTHYLKDFHPDSRFYGNFDGYGSLFKATKIRFLKSYRNVEEHIYL